MNLKLVVFDTDCRWDFSSLAHDLGILQANGQV